MQKIKPANSPETGEDLPELPLGRAVPKRLDKPAGFLRAGEVGHFAPPDWITPHREGHIISVAPTGSGKGASHLIPALLSWQGPTVVLDIKGEAWATTAQARRDMGHETVLLDPFAMFPEEESGAFNVLDLIDPNRPDFQEDCYALANRVAPERSVSDPFWDQSATQMIADLVAYVCGEMPHGLRNLPEVAYQAMQPGKDFDLTMKDCRRSGNTVIRRALSQLSGAEAKVKASIVSTAQRWMPVFSSGLLQSSITKTTFDPDALVRGDNISVYIVVPPHRLKNAAPLLRVWLGAMISLFQTRMALPPRETLFLIDEAWHLGYLPELETVTTLMRGYGVRLWSFWQDLEQIASRYPKSNATILNNTATICGFGFHNMAAQRQFADRLGFPGWAYKPLKPRLALLHLAGREGQLINLERFFEMERFRDLSRLAPLSPARAETIHRY
ncbi:type IV secretory system conjugative DNA transfer family protein [Ruegeria halocynthiae]|uniref:type IV secretory system conjugative DNA transfer family protein n=1 Tax=Ruegeria halocynthiae TaxID=985054 RepID=UPI00056D86E5|nr:type IV secretory system conjugative DNA transfer family protein [Ruegeria halocynthiae]